ALMDTLGTARGSFAGMPVNARLSTMREILRSEDAVVLGRADVAAMARRTYGKIAEFPADEPTALALIDVLRETNSPQNVPELAWLAENGRTAAVKAASLHALSVVDAAKAGKYVEQGLHASDAEVGRRLLESLAGTHVDLTEVTLNAALARADTRAL